MSETTIFGNHKHHVCMEMMKGEVADAVLEAIVASHKNVKVSDLPGYIIVEVPDRIEFDAESVRENLGREDWVMTDLNEVLHAFAGQIETYTENAFVLSRMLVKKGAH